MSKTNNSENKPRIYKADTHLQNKVGTGPLDEKAIERCQNVMNNNDVDFAPLAMEFLEKLENAIKSAIARKKSKEESIQEMTNAVMQLKANASTFHYTLIGNMANIMLSFLEGIQEIDNDAIAIVNAHHQTLKAIVLKKMSGDGGAIGKQMEDELKAACKRYFAKRMR
ncbi:MAG TPA: hypothetical protein PK513_00350 [Alphaproteobacteria bacterium]|nr:hypothetical protein [Alphaproteobacteria bacterium]USO05285.1 MAG: hypothetical protein H6859_09050 [Rhodospirillales bacterium]HOO80938.1 hypothetical protein [Alphaproteobacteria bacterium]